MSCRRLDSEGNRFGKVLDFKVSETRFMELLDDACKFADHYRLSDNGTWVDTRRKAAGLPEVPQAEQQAEQRRLRAECERLIENHEEDLIAGLQRPKAPSVRRLLCQELSPACRQTGHVPTEL